MWTEHDEAAAHAAHAGYLASVDPPEMDGWDGAHGRVGVLTEWELLQEDGEVRAAGYAAHGI